LNKFHSDFVHNLITWHQNYNKRSRLCQMSRSQCKKDVLLLSFRKSRSLNLMPMSEFWSELRNSAVQIWPEQPRTTGMTLDSLLFAKPMHSQLPPFLVCCYAVLLNICWMTWHYSLILVMQQLQKHDKIPVSCVLLIQCTPVICTSLEPDVNLLITAVYLQAKLCWARLLPGARYLGSTGSIRWQCAPHF